jgi:hypothetical protein
MLRSLSFLKVYWLQNFDRHCHFRHYRSPILFFVPTQEARDIKDES